MSQPPVRYRLIQQARDPERPGEYEDAVHIQMDEWPVAAAVADGATESMYAKQWAQRVVQGLADRTPTTKGAFQATVSDIRRAFRQGVGDARGDQPWYVTRKAAEGAHATALLLTLTAGGHWTALGVGDCCLFHVREECLQLVWPIDSAGAFGQRPRLLSSGASSERPVPNTVSGQWVPSDQFLLATDAVAQWLLRRMDDEQHWIDLLRLDDGGMKLAFEDARAAGTLRTDDATLLILEMDGKGGERPPSAADARSGGGCKKTRQ